MSNDVPVTIPVDFDPFSGHAADHGVPLTEPLREMWAAAQMGNDASCSYNQTFMLRLRGPLGVESMENALRRTIERHDALRVSIDENGEQQHIAAPLEIALPLIDHSALPEESRRRALEAMVQEEAVTPFDLTVAPLLRAKLVRESQQVHRLVVTIHHIVCDGWSSAIFLGDLAAAYAADRYGLAPTLPAAVSYRDYAINEVARSADATAREDEDYWVQQFADSIPVLDLPTDKPRPGFKTYSGATQELRLDETLCSAVKATGAKHGCTFFVTLLAAFEALLARLSGQDDFVVGIPMAGQALLESGHLVGHCVNMIPLRCRADQTAPFSDHLRSVRDSFLAAQSHQQLTFGSLVRRLRLSRESSRTPLVSVTFNIDKIGAPFDFGELALDAVETAPRRFVNFELSVNVVDSGRDLLIECHHNRDLYAAETIVRWMQHYRTLLAAIVRDPGQRIDELPLLTKKEEAQLKCDWNDTYFECPRDTLLHELCSDQATRTPRNTAFEFEGERLTYEELDRRTNQLARHLLTLGVRPDTLVPLCTERSLEMVIGMIGILKAGGAYVPVDPDYPRQRIAHILQDVQAPVALSQHRLHDRLPAGCGRIVDLDAQWNEIAGSSADSVPRTANPSSIAYVIYTSGSTGRPKGVLIPHSGICNLMSWMQARYRFAESDALLQKTPFGFDASVWEFFAPLIAGARLVLARPGGHLDPAYLAQSIVHRRISILKVVPSQLSLLLEEPSFAHCAPPLKRIFSGGEPLTPELCEAVSARLPGVTLHNLYGPTETSIDATVWDCPAGAIPPVVPIGKPVGNAQIYIVNARNRLAPIGVPGELLVGGVGVACGYLNQPELTAEKFIPDPFCGAPGSRVYRTGDLARYMTDGNVEYLGRMDSQVKLRGYRIELEEIESMLLQHPAIRQAAVVARTESSGDKRLVAYYVAEKQSTGLADQLRSHLRTAMPEYMVPTHFVQLAALPLTHNGKLDRRSLPPPDAIERMSRPAAVAPRTPKEALVLKLVRQVLGKKDIGIHDDFFDQGGDSLTAARLMARLRAASGMDLPLRNLFERPTAAQLAEALDALSWAASSAGPTRHSGDREQIEL
ncbi:MAG: non-ribosomal peptide synthetase [Betaproteobacteria bacterium]